MWKTGFAPQNHAHCLRTPWTGPTPDNGLDQETNPWDLPGAKPQDYLPVFSLASRSLRDCPPPTLGCATGQDIPQVNR